MSLANKSAAAMAAAGINAAATLAQIERMEGAAASARRLLDAGRVGMARVILLGGHEEVLSPRAGVAELIEAFEEIRPGFRNKLRGSALGLGRRPADPTFPPEFRAVAAAAGSAELYALMIEDAADRGDRLIVQEAVDGLVDAALKIARAFEATSKATL